MYTHEGTHKEVHLPSLEVVPPASGCRRRYRLLPLPHQVAGQPALLYRHLRHL